MKTKKIVMMGVSGCGKSLIGEHLAKQLNLSFIDGDDYHSPESISKMSQGIALTDQDRESWLQTLNTLIHQNSQVVVACSALTPKYRKVLMQNNPTLIFVYLKEYLEQPHKFFE